MRQVTGLFGREKIELGLFPTPMYRLENLSRALEIDLWVKRDDLCGVALGGNKVRKLEYLLCDARQKGYNLVMTTGQAQSNHAMLTAACALRLGMEPVLVLKNRGITACRGNQLLNRMMGVDVRLMDTASYDDIYAEMDRIAAEKGKPVYKIPCGGSNALGSLGYVECMKEIAESGTAFDHVAVACGSGGTAAGVALGIALYMPHTKVLAVTVDDDPFDQIVHGIMSDAIQSLGLPVTDAPLPQFMPMYGPGYAIPSEEGNAACAMMLRQEGIVLDPCYTGKAFAGVIQAAKQGCFQKDERVLFIHTGGAGGLFAPDWEGSFE